MKFSLFTVQAMYEDQGRRMSGNLVDTSDQIRQFEENVIKKRKLTETTHTLKTELRSKSGKMRPEKEKIRLHVLNRSKSSEKKLDVERKLQGRQFDINKGICYSQKPD